MELRPERWTSLLAWMQMRTDKCFVEMVAKNLCDVARTADNLLALEGGWPDD